MFLSKIENLAPLLDIADHKRRNNRDSVLFAITNTPSLRPPSSTTIRPTIPSLGGTEEAFEFDSASDKF